jgi:uncharacterized protein
MLLGKCSDSVDTGVELIPSMANRHGLIAGATGTGKTITLKLLAENFSRLGVPVFVTDIKGDLSGTALAGGSNPKVDERVKALGLEGFNYEAHPVVFWDVYGEQGHPVRTTVSELGPILMSRLLELNDTQDSVLTLLFQVADDEGLLVLNLDDLSALLQHAVEHAKELSAEYGLMSKQTLGAIQRQVQALKAEMDDRFFGEPALNLADWLTMATTTDATTDRGPIHMLAADKLMLSPKVYAVFLLWLLSELYETLPEVGDMDKPKLVLFFDEAHLMFTDAPKVLLDKMTQVIRLIRSKGVGVYFVTQNPLDIDETVLGQLGNRIQHALRVFSPKDQKALKAVVDGFRPNPKLDLEAVIPELGVGEAVVSVLDEKGLPTVTQRVLIAPPRSFIGPIDAATRQAILTASCFTGQYDTAVDRESAAEVLKARLETPQPEPVAAATASSPGAKNSTSGLREPRRREASRRRDDPMQAFIKSAARAAGSTVTRQILRGIMGAILK